METSEITICEEEAIRHERSRRLFDFTSQLMDEFKAYISATSSFRLATTSKIRFDARQKRPLTRLFFLASERRAHCKQFYPVSAFHIYI